jgi:hypothetical protein
MFGNIDVVVLAQRCAVPTLVVLGRDKDTPLGQDGTIMGDLERYSALIGEERRRFCASLRGARVHAVAGGHHFYRELSAELLGLLSIWLRDTEPTERPPALSARSK